MKTLYLFTTRIMNGTVCISTESCGFLDKKLADKAMQAVVERNNEGKDKATKFGFSTMNDVKEITVYESEDEVPILN